jgi:hypothetical protein
MLLDAQAYIEVVGEAGDGWGLPAVLRPDVV